jgi:hypothetical protein
MSRDSTVIPFRQPEAIDDPLTEVAREGARLPGAALAVAINSATPGVLGATILMTRSG